MANKLCVFLIYFQYVYFMMCQTQEGYLQFFFLCIPRSFWTTQEALHLNQSGNLTVYSNSEYTFICPGQMFVNAKSYSNLREKPCSQTVWQENIPGARMPTLFLILFSLFVVRNLISGEGTLSKILQWITRNFTRLK